MRRLRCPAPINLFACIAAAACSNGGAGPPTWTEVAFSASNHMFFFSTGGWSSVPISPQRVFAGYSRFQMFGDGMYTFTDANGQGGSSAQRYMLDDDGFLTLIRGTSSPLPSDEGIGGVYSRVGASDLRSPGSTPDFFLTRILVVEGTVFGGGTYLGTRVVPGPIELTGDWHLLSLHLILEQAAPSPDSVGRGAHGTISIASGAPGSPRSIAGNGSQGTTSVTFGGTIQDRLGGTGGGDGTCNLTVSYQPAGQAADDRVMLAAARPDMVFGLDADSSDGEAGRLFLVRTFDSAAPVDPARVPGRFLFCGQTLIVNPAQARDMEPRGVVTLAASGGFTIDVAPFGYVAGYSHSGSWTLTADGGLTLSIPDGNQTWFAAIDRGYNTLVFVDDFVEPGTAPALTIGFGVREKTPN